MGSTFDQSKKFHLDFQVLTSTTASRLTAPLLDPGLSVATFNQVLMLMLMIVLMLMIDDVYDVEYSVCP